MTDWDAVHRDVVERFRIGWDRPHPHAWDDFLDERVRFVQPMLDDGEGPEFWWEEAARTLALMPDLRADVLGWAGSGDQLFIRIRFSATLGGKPITWDAVDLLRVTPAGKAVLRESFFDSTPIAATLLARPGSWLTWWRSGIGPLSRRRRYLSAVRLNSVPTAHPSGGS